MNLNVYEPETELPAGTLTAVQELFRVVPVRRMIAVVPADDLPQEGRQVRLEHAPG